MPSQWAHLYNDRRWKKASKQFRLQHPLCQHCLTLGKVNSSALVDHIDAHKGDLDKFWDRNNWQALCFPCHSIKTAANDMGREAKPKGHSLDGLPTHDGHPWS